MVTSYGPAIRRARSVLAVGSVSAVGAVVAFQIVAGFSADAATKAADPSTTIPVLWDNGSFAPAVVTLPAGDTVVVDNEDANPITLERTEAPVFSVTIQPTASAALPFTADVAPGTYKVQIEEGNLTPDSDTALSVTIPAAATPTDSPSATPSPTTAPSSGDTSASPSTSATPTVPAGTVTLRAPATSAAASSPAAAPVVVAPTTPAAPATSSPLAPSEAAASEALAATIDSSPSDSATPSASDSASPVPLEAGAGGYVVPHLSLLDGELAPEAPAVVVAAPLVAGAPATVPAVAPSPSPSAKGYRTIEPQLVAANQVVNVQKLGLPAGLAFVLLAGLSVTIGRVAISRRLVHIPTTRFRPFI